MSRYWVFVATSGVVSLLLIVVGMIPTRRLAGPDGIPALVAGCLIGFAASAMSGLPAALVKSEQGNAVVLALLGTGIRAVVVAVAALLLVLASGLPKVPLLIWTGVGYLAMLPLETRFVLRSTARNSGPEPLEIS